MRINFHVFLLILAALAFQTCTSTGTPKGTTLADDGSIISARGALGKLETAPSGPLFSGDGGKNIRLAVLAPQVQGDVPGYLPVYIQGLINNNFNKFSAVNLIDRQNLDRIISEQKIAASGNYSDNDFVKIGNLTNAQYFLFGTIQKLSGESYALQLSITDSSTGVRKANFMRGGTLSHLEGRGTLINEATAELLSQLGVNLTEIGMLTLMAGNTSVVKAEAGLARGITAQAGGSEIEALFNFTQAITFDPSRIEALSRLNTLSSTISEGTISQRIVTDIQARDSWLNAFKETAKFFNEHPPFEIFFDPNLIQIGQTDYAKHRASIGMRIALDPSQAGFSALNALLEGLEKTGRRGVWGFSGWPLTDVAPKTAGTVVFNGRRSFSYKVDVALINEENKTIGNGNINLTTEAISFSAGDKIVMHPESIEEVVHFRNIKAQDLTPTLTIVIRAVNGISSRNLSASGYMKIETGDLEQRYEKSASALLASGIKSVVDSRDYNKAISDFTQAINLNSNLASAYILRGRALHASVSEVLYIEKNFNGFGHSSWGPELTRRFMRPEKKEKLDKALEDLNNAVNLDPNNANSYLERGKIYYSLGDGDKSIVDINQAIKLKPDYAMAYNFRSDYYLDKGDDDKAFEDINRAIKLEPNEGWHYFERAGLYIYRSDYDKTIADYTQAIKLDPDNTHYYYNRGSSYSSKKDYDRAIADYTQVLKLNPNDAFYYNLRALAYYDNKSYDLAVADYTQAIWLGPDNARFYNNRGRAYNEKGDYDRAIADFTQAIRLDSNYADAYWWRGVSYYDKKDKDYDRAIADFTQVIRLKSYYYSINAYWFRGASYHYGKRDYDKAIADYEMALKINPNIANIKQNLANAYNERGIAYYNNKSYGKAIEDFTQAIRLDSNYANAYQWRGATYYEKKDYDRAITDYTQAIRLDPNDAVAYNMRGNAYYGKKDWNRAIADYEMALKIDPNHPYAKQSIENAKQARGR